MTLREITDQISYFPATHDPFSADIGVIRFGDELWLFDVGETDQAAAAVNSLPGKKTVVLSHFHGDHAGNIGRVSFDALYAGPFTCRKLGMGREVRGHMVFENGVHLFSLPSAHAKGCVGLEYAGFAFLGDATYAARKDGMMVYNAGLLRELILVLKGLEADKLLLSHRDGFVRPKAEVIAKLESIYAARDPQEPYISAGPAKPRRR